MRATTVLAPTIAASHEEDHEREKDCEILVMHGQASVSQPLYGPSELYEHSEQQFLINQILQGDIEAFSQIVHEYSPLMLRTACMIVGDHDVAEDAVQDALIQAWQHLSGLRETGSLRPWLLRIVVNQCISFKRRLARSAAFIHQSLTEQMANAATQFADDCKGRMEYNWDLARAIEHLPPKQRAVIILHYYNGMTLPEMARTLQTSENTLKKRIQMALVNLRRILPANDADESAYTRHGGYFSPISAASCTA